MFCKGIATTALLTILLTSSAVLSQQKPAAPGSTAGQEFPVIMRQNVAAGKTPVGTKIQATLVVATMANGVVIPRDALLSGEVTESVAKTKTDPSRLAVRMDSAEWKNGSAAIKVYLTSWYYPVVGMRAQDLSYQPADATTNNKRTWNGMGTYPDPNNPVSQQRFPGGDLNKDTGLAPATTASSISQHRELMKSVESTRESDGAIALTSTHLNLKLDKTTTYVLASGDLPPKN